MRSKSHIELLNSPNLFTKYETTSKGRGVIASPLEYEDLMKEVPKGKVITIEELKVLLAKKHKVDYTCPQATGFYINMVAKASKEKEALGSKKIIPYWRTLKKNGELNEGYPEGALGQKVLLEEEGHVIIEKGKKYFVKNFKESIFQL